MFKWYLSPKLKLDCKHEHWLLFYTQNPLIFEILHFEVTNWSYLQPSPDLPWIELIPIWKRLTLKIPFRFYPCRRSPLLPMLYPINNVVPTGVSYFSNYKLKAKMNWRRQFENPHPHIWSLKVWNLIQKLFNCLILFNLNLSLS